MLKFTKAKPYSFEVDGKAYALPAMTLDVVEDFDSVLSAPPAEQSRKMMQMLESHADKRTLEAIRKHIPVASSDPDVLKLEDLFLDWAGMRKSAVTPGESERSPEQ